MISEENLIIDSQIINTEQNTSNSKNESILDLEEIVELETKEI